MSSVTLLESELISISEMVGCASRLHLDERTVTVRRITAGRPLPYAGSRAGRALGAGSAGLLPCWPCSLVMLLAALPARGGSGGPVRLRLHGSTRKSGRCEGHLPPEDQRRRHANTCTYHGASPSGVRALAPRAHHPSRYGVASQAGRTAIKLKPRAGRVLRL